MAKQSVFVVLCLKSPTRALAKRSAVQWNKEVGRLGSFHIRRRELASSDPLPDPSWAERVVAVVEARGRTVNEDVLEWLEGIAMKTGGALYDPSEQEFPFVDGDEAAARTKGFLARGDIEALVRWIAVVVPAAYEYQSPRWQTLDAIRDVVLPKIRRAKLDATQRCALAIALHRAYDDDKKIEALVVETAKGSTDEEHREVAAAIVDRGEREADAGAATPRTSAQLAKLLDELGSASAERRLQRFIYESRDTITRLAIKAVEDGYDPSPDVCTRVLEALPIEMFDEKAHERLWKTTQSTALAQAFRAAVQTYREGAGQRAAEYSQRRFEEYERYRNDPLVLKPRSRGDDIAMLRGLNDALYGLERDRPLLPERIVALICDRRLDEARAAYVEALGETHADAAIHDAAAYFLSDID